MNVNYLDDLWQHIYPRKVNVDKIDDQLGRISVCRYLEPEGPEMELHFRDGTEVCCPSSRQSKQLIKHTAKRGERLVYGLQGPIKASC